MDAWGRMHDLRRGCTQRVTACRRPAMTPHLKTKALNHGCPGHGRGEDCRGRHTPGRRGRLCVFNHHCVCPDAGRSPDPRIRRPGAGPLINVQGTSVELEEETRGLEETLAVCVCKMRTDCGYCSCLHARFTASFLVPLYSCT